MSDSWDALTYFSEAFVELSLVFSIDLIHFISKFRVNIESHFVEIRVVAPPLFPVSVEELTNEANYAMRIEKENLTKSPYQPVRPA